MTKRGAVDTAPPIAKRIPYARSLHGKRWLDNYHWLRAEHWEHCIENPDELPSDIKDYLLAENNWFDQCMADTSDLQAALTNEMRARIIDLDQSLPDVIGPWCYIERYEAGDEHPRYYRYPKPHVTADCLTIEEESMQVLVDFNVQASGHEYYDPGDCEHSPQHGYLAWSEDTKGSERYQLRVRNLTTGSDEDTIKNIYSMAWASESVLFYTRLDDTLRPNRVYRHTVGAPVSEDVLVYEESDIRFHCSVWLSASAEYIFISSDMDDQSEVWFISTKDSSGTARVIQKRQEGIEYSVEHQGSCFFIMTNADDAYDFKIVTAPCASPQRENWNDWLIHRPGVMLLEFFTCKQWTIWLERTNALPRICFCKSSHHPCKPQILAFSEEAYALSLEPLAEYDTSEFRFSIETPSMPAQTWSFNMDSGKRTLLKQDVLPNGHDSRDYIVKRLYAPAMDDEQIPVTLIYRKSFTHDATAPCLLSAYGAYGDSMPASFDSNVLSLVDRGFVYAIAHVRGGQEKGRRWYDAARGIKKQNTFDDTIAVAQYLIATSHTGKQRIVLSGGSAGGLTVGAVINQCPDLWAGAVADVPFVDALNSLIDDTLPLTPGEWAQWGNPLESQKIFDAIRSWSPYDNISNRQYPPMLVTAGVSDPRVTYWEPAKWVARHRHIRDDKNLLLLRTNMGSGHFGITGRYASLEDDAISYAFAIKVTRQP